MFNRVKIDPSIKEEWKDIQRQLIGQSSNQINLGVNIPQVTTVGGTIRLDGSNVMENDNILNESRLGGQGAPGMPNVTAKVNTKGGGKFLADEVSAGTSYKVVVYADKSGSLFQGRCRNQSSRLC